MGSCSRLVAVWGRKGGYRMSLTQCPACGKVIAAIELACPNCSIRLTKPRTIYKRKADLTAVVIILGVCLSIMLGVIVRVIAQSGIAAIGTLAAGVCFTICIAARKK